MALDRYTAVVHKMMAASYPDLGGAVTDAVAARTMYDKARFPVGPESVAAQDRVIDGGLRVRIYRPDGAAPGAPILVYLHGGGWTICGLDSHDGACRTVAAEAGAVVVSVEYRLAPEHKYPAAPDDAYTALCWVCEHAAEFGGGPVAVGGDSAGGALAASSCLRARDLGGPEIAFQLLVYPVTDCLAVRSDRVETSLLTATHMRWFTEQYLADRADGEHPYASPLRAASLADLPPALVLIAEHDPLREEGEAFAIRLAEAGVPTAAYRVRGMFHGLFGLGGLAPVARTAERLAAAGLAGGLAAADRVASELSGRCETVVHALGVPALKA